MDFQELFKVYGMYAGNIHDVLPPTIAGAVLTVTAIIAGIIVGLERELRGKPAGMRTVALICLGSAIFTIVSVLLAGDGTADRSRVAAQVVSGIGFLGAGSIIRDRGRVSGLTTAATIWVVAAIGVVIGTGYAVSGLALSIVVTILLRGLELFEAESRSSEDS